MAFTLKNVAHKTVYNPKKEDTQDSLKIVCQVNRFIYTDEESGFFVFAAHLSPNEPNVSAQVNGKHFADRKFAVVGTSLIMVQAVQEGQEVEVWGYFEPGKNPGSVQFSATAIQECIPTKPKAIEVFLGSGKIYGIGPKTAKKIVNKFGAETIHILDTDIERLLEVESINLKKLEVIKESWSEWRSVYEIVATMRIYGVGDTAGVKIFNHFKERSIHVIKNDPYLLTEVPTIGFKTADRIAQSIGISPVDEKRIEKCILYTLEEISEKGHTAYPKTDLIDKVNETLTIDPDLIKAKIEELIHQDLLIPHSVKVKVSTDKYKGTYTIVESEGVAHKKIYNTEVRIAKELKRICDFPIAQDEKKARKEITEFLKHNPNGLDDSQLEAARTILNNKVCVLTGGPGTGKTHTIKSLLQYFDNAGNIAVVISGNDDEQNGSKVPSLKTVLSAPTGRAAKRMEESTGKAGSTMHRLLGFKEGSFVHGEHNKLKGDVFIVDESSMIDIWLANAFLKAIPSEARVIFVGDVDQLPSVGAGNVLRDIIDSNCIPVCRLSVIHRQALNSNIIVASHAIINKKVPELHDIKSNSDFVFVEKEGNGEIHDAILDIVSDLLSKGISHNDIQILSPKKETEVGTHALNNTLRALLNPQYARYHEMKTRFVPGDRVMQFKNDRELEIFNGDVGFVHSVDEENSSINVIFDERMLNISGKEISHLNLSNAITIHKSQGSDYPYVIIPISKSHTFMWDANLLYTAVTRGKFRVILVGEKKTLFFSVAQFKQNDRITGLKDQLIELFTMSNEPEPRQRRLF
jgi:exodeoxyribonuclease V alpha subunit